MEQTKSGKGRNVVCKRYFKNVLYYCDYSRLCNVIYKFPEFSPDMLNNGITSPLYTSQRAIEQRDTHITSFEMYVNQIYRNTNDNFQ